MIFIIDIFQFHCQSEQIKNEIKWNDSCLNQAAFFSIYKVLRYSNHCVKSVKIRRFFWSVFSHTRTEYGEIRSISPHSIRIRENTQQKKLRIWTHFTQWITFEIYFLMRFFSKMNYNNFSRNMSIIFSFIPLMLKKIGHF